MVGTNTTNIVRGHLTGCMSHVTIRTNVCINSVVNCGVIGEQLVQCSVVIVADLHRGLHHCMFLVPMYNIRDTFFHMLFSLCTDQKL